MTSRSKRNSLLRWGILAVLSASVLAGCKDDLGEANKEKVNADEAKKVQQGQGGVKAQQGGGLVDEPMAAPPGVKLGMPGPGTKAR